ncbi:MAG TPA: hypothetical protein VIJ93_07745 [bacterium]
MNQISKNDENKKFKIEGIIQSDIIIIYFWNIDRQQRGIGSMTLEVINGGKELRGLSAFFSPRQSNIVSNGEIFSRKRS